MGNKFQKLEALSLGATLLVLIACLTLSRPVKASTAELVIPAVEACEDQMVAIPIKMRNAGNLAGVRLILEYEPRHLAYDHAAKTTASNAFVHVVNEKRPGVLIVVMAGAKGIEQQDYTLLHLYFQARKTTAGRVVSKIRIHEFEAMDDQLKRLECDLKINPLTIWARAEGERRQ
jgi:hypothetical protein